MARLNRRAAIGAAAACAVAAGTVAMGGAAAGEEPSGPKLWTLEGELKAHPKFLYRYYLTLLIGQTCALYGPDHEREPELLARLELPLRIRVCGELGAANHPGGTEENPSPFPAGCYIYMKVHEVEPLG